MFDMTSGWLVDDVIGNIFLGAQLINLPMVCIVLFSSHLVLVAVDFPL